MIIPTRDRPEALRRAVRSVSAQSLPPQEVVVVDDGSSLPVDPTFWGASPVPVRMIRNEVARGPAAARNLGAVQAVGEFVAFLDDDDLWLPGKLEIVWRCLAEYPEADVVIHRTGFEPSPVDRAEWWMVDDPLARMLCTQPPHLDGVIVRRTLHAASPFDESLPGAADLDYLIRLAKAGARTVEIPLTLAVHGKRGPSAVGLEDRIQGRLQLLSKHPEILSDPVAASFFYLRLGHQYRRAGQRARAVGSFVRSLRARRNASALKGLALTSLPMPLQRRVAR